MEVENEEEAARKARMASTEEVENEEEAVRKARRTEREPEQRPIDTIKRYGMCIGTWRTRRQLRIEEHLDDYCMGGVLLEPHTLINVVEVKSDMLGTVMGRILDPQPGWVVLCLVSHELCCDWGGS